MNVTGPAKKGIAPILPDFTILVYNKRNVFWDFILGKEPIESVEFAKKLAEQLIDEVKKKTNQAVKKPYYWKCRFYCLW